MGSTSLHGMARQIAENNKTGQKSDSPAIWIPGPFMNADLKTFYHKLESWWAEFSLGIDTRGFVNPPTSEGVHYTPLPYPIIFKMRKLLAMKPEDVFYDIGCGKGRVVCCMCQEPIKKVVAIELNEELLQQTLNNVSKLKNRKCPVEPLRRSA